MMFFVDVVGLSEANSQDPSGSPNAPEPEPEPAKEPELSEARFHVVASASIAVPL